MTNRIDFQVIFTVEHANPNGDPIDGNRPRQLSDGYGEVTDVCLKRKIRNRFNALGENILIKSTDKCDILGDEPYTVLDRYQTALGEEIENLNPEHIKKGLHQFIDIRLFGQVYAFFGKNEKKKEISHGEHTRGAVSITNAYSAFPIEIEETQITKSICNKDKTEKGADTMGMQYAIPFGIYSFFGSVSGRVAEENGVTEEDIALLKKALCTLFQDDYSTARPYGSMNIEKVVWYEHDSQNGQVRPDIVKSALQIQLAEGKETATSIDDCIITLEEIPGLKTEIIDKPW